MTETQKVNAKRVLKAINDANGTITANGLMKLIAVTNAVKVPTIVQLHNYTSDKSENTELSDYTLNIGTKYGNAKKQSVKKFADLDADDLKAIAVLCTPESIKGFQYINRKNLTADEYCNEVIDAIPQAIEELKTPSTRKVNVIRLNETLSFNVNTGNLLIAGELIKGGKKIKVESTTIKMVAKAPKTVAKEVIKNYLNARSSKIRSFSITNLNTISVNHQKIALVEV